MAEREKLRSDLEIHPEPDSSVIIKDPIIRRFYRFTSVQASALALLNGVHSFKEIAEEVAEKHQTEVLEQHIKDFCGKLQNLLLLDNSYCWSKLEKAKSKKRRLIRSILYIKFHVFSPDSLLTRIEEKCRFCFSPAFSAAVWIFTAIAIVISILNYESLFFSMSSLFTLYSIPLIIAVIFGVTTIHEFAHGIMLKHYGGKVEEIGFLVLYFIPAFYCNVNDAWMLKKRERVWVSLAGSYAQMILWSLATIAWRLLATETFLSRLCLVVIVCNGIQTLFNFNPLIRLDGYYLLSDVIEIPNLRTKAFSYLKRALKSTILEVPSNKNDSAREKRWFLWYGTASALFTFAVLWFMFQRLGGWMIREFNTWGVVLISTLFLMAIPMPEKEKDENSGSSIKRLLERMRKKPAVPIIVIVVLIIGFFPWELKVSGDFTMLASSRASITPQVDGHIKKILVDLGSRVTAGDEVAEIENLDLSNSYQEVKGELAAQEASLDLLKAGTRPEEIDRAKKQIDTKNAELDNTMRIDQERAMLRQTIAKKEASLESSRLNNERLQSLLKTGIVSRDEADRARIALEVSQKELMEAKGQLNVLEEQAVNNLELKRKELEQAHSELKILEAGTRKETIRATESEVIKLKEKLKILGQQMDLLIVRSPIDGTVSTPYLKNHIGDYFEKGKVFCEIVSNGTVVVEMPVPEKEIGDVRVGFPITIKVRGYPKLWYEAKVKSIAPTASTNSVEQIVIVHGELQNPDGDLKTGMTGVGKIRCGQRMIFNLVARRAVRWLRTEFWEYLP